MCVELGDIRTQRRGDDDAAPSGAIESGCDAFAGRVGEGRHRFAEGAAELAGFTPEIAREIAAASRK